MSRAPFTRPHFIVNARSVGAGTPRLDALHSAVRSVFPGAAWSPTTRAGDAADLAGRAAGDGADLVVAVGGDGTINEVVNGLLSATGAPPLGILPLGSGCDFARALGVRRTVAGALHVLASGRTRRIDLGEIECDPLAASLGPARTRRFFVNIVPSLIALMEALVRHGYGLDLYTWHDWEDPPPLAPLEDVRLFLLPQTVRQGQGAWRWQFFGRWLPFLWRQLGRERNCGVLGVDHWGLLLANLAARLKRIPVIYLSLELYFRDEMSSPYLMMLKRAERWCSRSAALTLIQDEDRAALLMAENGIGPERLALLPNGWWESPGAGKTADLRRTLGLEAARIIVLYAGSISEWTQTLELAQAARTWPENWAMVFHAPGSLESPYERAFLRQIDGVHTHLLQARLDLPQLLEMIRGADIGIALHQALEAEKNTYTLGLSSGKIALYLHCGLPIVTTGLPTVRKFVEPYGCGICVDRATEVQAGVAILPDYAAYSVNALTCYREKFALPGHLADLCRRLTKITG